jgi:hypothetical protein
MLMLLLMMMIAKYKEKQHFKCNMYWGIPSTLPT